MKLSDLLGKTFDCKCGRTHTVPTEYFFYSSDAIERLPEIANQSISSPAFALLADIRTYEAAGRKVEKVLKQSGASVRTLIVPDVNGESPVTDNATLTHILNNVPPVEAFVAVGSGVINDLTKWAAHERGKPYFAVPTAASMNGYASANVSATIDDLKVLFKAQACKGVFAVPSIIENAPFDLTSSGLGDVVAKAVSSPDWKLNQFLFDEYYCQFSVDLLKDLEPIYLDHPEKIREKDSAGIQALFEALFYSSIAMTITGTSSPASGGEHLFSHTLDMTLAAENRKHDFHGRQVGVGTILSAALYEKVLATENPDFGQMSSQINENFWGSLSQIVGGEYHKKQVKFKIAAEKLSKGDNWDQLRSIIQKNLLPAEKLKKCLQNAGAAHQVGDIRIDDQPADRDTILKIWIHANQMRDRFTVLDLAAMLGIMPDRAREIVDEWI
jgi:glycerol-1-phosphate dehydrogenase [NAD(P)+]